VEQVLEYWNVADKRALRRGVLAMNSADRNEVKRFYGGMAPIVTGCAEQAPLASESCRWLVRATGRGVRLLAEHFSTSPVPVGLEGGLASCLAFRTRMVAELAESTCGRVQVMPTILDPVGGAVLAALQHIEIDTDNTVIERLKPSNRPASAPAVR
jgi:glucosamine kinase